MFVTYRGNKVLDGIDYAGLRFCGSELRQADTMQQHVQRARVCVVVRFMTQNEQPCL